MLRCSDYSERVVAIPPHQIQSEYHGGNISVSIEVITLENFSALQHTEINSPKKPCSRHAVFHSFCKTTEKKILPLLLHTENVLLNC